MTDDGAAAACVYVTQALLDALERDKRTLKWQLARATTAVDEHAAQRAACEAKVKDLMTIVEMNKSVAHKAVQRNYTKESVLQRLHHERAQLQTQVETQRRHGIETLERRVTTRRQRETFQIWTRDALLRSRRRRAIRRIARSRRRRWIREAFSTWRHEHRPTGETVRTTSSSAIVHPISSLHSCTYSAPDKLLSMPQPQVRFALSPSSSIRSESTTMSSSVFGHAFKARKSLSFATWKSQWLARKRRQATACHFARLILVKRVLMAWKHGVRRRNWRESMIASATRRRRHRCFTLWASWTTRRRRARSLLCRIVQRAARRSLRHAFVRFRIKCLERCMVEWTEVLRDARQAMDEERKMYALHQSETMREIEKKASHQQAKLTSLVDAKHKAMEKKQRVAVLMKYLAQWQHHLILYKMHTRVADQYHAFRRRRRHVRFVFSTWKARVQQLRAVLRFRKRRSACDKRGRLATTFAAFVETTRSLIMQKKCLQRICRSRRILKTSRAFWKWRGAVALADEQANAHLEQRELIDRLEIRQTASQCEAQRLRRVGYKYQLRCALAQGDIQLERRRRRIFTAWKVNIFDIRKKRTTMRKLVRRKARLLLKLATHRWWKLSDDHNTRLLALRKRAKLRDEKLMKAVFTGWRAAFQRDAILAAQGGLQFMTLLLWRKRCNHQHARSAALGVLLKLHVRHRWKKPAFQKWRRRTEVAAGLDSRHQQRRQELLRCSFQSWSVWLTRRSRLRKLQFKTIASRAESRAMHRLLVVVWVGWRDRARQRKVVTRLMNVSHSAICKSDRFLRLRRSWLSWVSLANNRRARQVGLRRVFCHQVTRTKREVWHRWQAIVGRENGIRAGQALGQRKIQQRARADHVRQGLHRILRDWRQITQVMKQRRLLSNRWFNQHQARLLMGLFTQWWSHFVPLMQFRRILLRVVVAGRRKAWLRFGIQKWRHETHQGTASRDREHSSSHHWKVQSHALIILQRAMAGQDLRAHFVAWRSHCREYQIRKRVLKRLIKKKAKQCVQVAWARWVKRVIAYESLRRAAFIGIQFALRLAWYRLHTVSQVVRSREDGARRLTSVVIKALLRCMWIQWKRRDHALLVFQIASTQTVSNKILEVYMNRVGRRHFTKSLLARVFGHWKAHASHQHLLRRRVVLLLTERDSHNVKQCFRSWALETVNQRNGRRVLIKVITRRNFALQRGAFIRWCTCVTEVAHNAKLRDMQRQSEADREALARRVAMAMFSSWQKPTLVAVLHGWKGVVNFQKRTSNDLFMRQSTRRIKMVWTSWRRAVERRKSVRSALVAVLDRQQRRAIGVAWCLWIERIQWADTVSVTILRLLTSLRFRLLRSGWQSLRIHQDLAMRHQSMMAVVSAQQQLNQQKEVHRRRSVAFIRQRHQKGILRERFALWNDCVASRKELTAMLRDVSKRYARRSSRAVLRAWSGVMAQRQMRARRIDKWQKTQCRIRLMRVMWRSWGRFAASQYQARVTIRRLLGYRAKLALLAAWKVWQSAVDEQVENEKAKEIEHWRRATTDQQNEIASLEVTAEMLLLESVGLKRTVQTQRQRCVQALVGKIERAFDAASTRTIKTRWAHWVLAIDRLSAARWLVEKIAASRNRELFLRWKQDTQLHKKNQREKTMLKKVARILMASTLLMQKKKMWRQWVAYAKQRRAKRIQQRVLDGLKRKQEGGIILRCVFGSWKAVVWDRKHRHGAALNIMKTVNHKLLRLVMGAWTRGREDRRSKREAMIMLSRIAGAIQRRRVQRHWLEWRNCVIDDVVVVAKSRVMLMETKASEQEARSIRQTVSLRFLTVWREVTTQRRLHRADRHHRQEQFDTLRGKRKIFYGWRELVHANKLKEARNQRPVLCVRTNAKKRCNRMEKTTSINPERGAILSFADYTQRRNRVHWRVHLSRRVTQTRLRRFLGLSWLLRSLRRNHLRIQHRALWRWFAVIQPISCALQAVSFTHLPWCRSDVDFAGTMLLLTLEELDLARQTHRTAVIQHAWCVVEAVARSVQRRTTQRAFHKWRWDHRPRPTSLYSAAMTRRSLGRRNISTERTRARAWITQLTRVILRRAFRTWKSHYVASAIEMAQANYDALQEALARTVMERRTRESH